MAQPLTDTLSTVDINSSRSACVGSAASYLMRRISLNAGQPDPGVYEWVFYPLLSTVEGSSLDAVESWMEKSLRDLHRLGYRLCGRRVAFETESICGWVGSGNGYRGAVLATNGSRLRAEIQPDADHAVAIAADVDSGRLVMVDPWPGAPHARPVPPQLSFAHREKRYGAIVFYWSGWS